MPTPTNKKVIDKEAVHWYVTRCHSQAHNKVRSLLTAKAIEFFVPETMQVVTEKGKKTKKMTPVFKDLFFVHASFNQINDYIHADSIPIIFYFSHTSHIQDDALWVSDREMIAFMRALSCIDNNPTVRPFGEINFKKGDYIRVADGPLEGIEGYFVQLRRGQRKQLVITLSNLMTVNLAVGKDDLIEILPKDAAE